MGLPFRLDVEALAKLSPGEREEVQAQLEELEARAKANPLWGYVPHAQQVRYHGISAFVGAFVGGNRSGKSFGGTADDIIQLVDAESLPPWLVSAKRWEGECFRRVVTPSIVTTLEPVVLPLFRKLCPRDQLWKGSWDKAYDKRLRRLQFQNGNWVDFLTHDMELDSFSGASLHGIRFDEEPKGHKGKLIFDESLMRLVDHGGEFRMTFTPLFGLSWAYYELTTKGTPRWDEDVQVVTVDIEDNPHLNAEARERILKKIPANMRAARKSGRFIHFAGTIFPEWDELRHVIPDADLPRAEDGSPTVSVFEGLDPGSDHPAAWVAAYVELTEDELPRLVVFDSFKLRRGNAAEVAELIHEKRSFWGYKPRWMVIDPSARNKNHATGRSLQDEYRRHGIFSIPGQNSRPAGYSRVSELLGINPDDEPMLLVMARNSNEDPEMPGLVEEFPIYRWKESTRGEGLGRGGEPVKVKDDLLDALRYLIMSNPSGLRLGEDDDPPPSDFAGAAGWEQRQRVKSHIKRLTDHKAGRARIGAILNR